MSSERTNEKNEIKKNNRKSMSFHSTAYIFPNALTASPQPEEKKEAKEEIEAKKKSIKQGLLNIRNKLFKKQETEIFEGSTPKIRTPVATPLNRSPNSTPSSTPHVSPRDAEMIHKLERKDTLESFFENSGKQNSDHFEINDILKNTNKCEMKYLEKKGTLWLRNKENSFEEKFIEVVGIQMKIYKSAKKEKKSTKTLSLFNFKIEKLDNWSISKRFSNNSSENSVSFLFNLQFPTEEYSFATSIEEEYNDWLDLFELFELRNFSATKPVHFMSKLNEMELRIQDEHKLILEEKEDFEKLNSNDVYSFDSIEELYHKRIEEIKNGINIH
eukprot:gene4381-7756_t